MLEKGAHNNYHTCEEKTGKAKTTGKKFLSLYYEI